MNRLPILRDALPRHGSATNQNRAPESSANQNRRLRHRELSARVEDPSRLSARVGWL